MVTIKELGKFKEFTITNDVPLSSKSELYLFIIYGLYPLFPLFTYVVGNPSDKIMMYLF